MKTKIIKTIGLSLLLSLVGAGWSTVGAEALKEVDPDIIEAGFSDTTTALSGHSLNDYLTYAASHNPGLKAAFYAWRSRLEQVSAAKGLPNPELSYSRMLESNGDQSVMLMQSFPWFGTLGAQGRMAFNEADISYRSFQSAKLKLFYDLKTAYYDYYLLGKEIEAMSDNLELLKYLEKVLTGRYQTSLTDHADLIKIQVELGKLENDLQALREQTNYRAANLRAVMNLSDSIALPFPSAVDTTLPEIAGDSVRQLILNNNPDLAAFGSMVDRENSSLKLARKADWPDFSLGLSWMRKSSLMTSDPNEKNNSWEATVSVGLPIWFGKNRAGKRSAAAAVKQAQYEYADAHNQLGARVNQILADYRNGRREEKLYRLGLIPKGRQSLSAVYAAYEAGATEIMNLIDAHRQLLEFTINYETALTTAAVELAQLQMLAGDDNLGRVTSGTGKQ